MMELFCISMAVGVTKIYPRDRITHSRVWVKLVSSKQVEGSMNVGFLAITLHSSYTQCYPWGPGDLSVLFLTSA